MEREMMAVDLKCTHLSEIDSPNIECWRKSLATKQSM